MRIFLAIIENNLFMTAAGTTVVLMEFCLMSLKDPTRYDWIIVGRVWETHTSQTAACTAGIIYFAWRKIRYLWHYVTKICPVVGRRQILGPFVGSAKLWESAWLWDPP